MKAVGGLVLVAVVALGAWYQMGNTDALKTASEIAGRACECKEQACTEPVIDELIALFDEVGERVGSEAEANSFAASVEATMNCLASADVSEDSLQRLAEHLQ